MRTRAILVSLGLLSCYCPCLYAQAINIDYGVDAGAPVDTFGAAASQPGIWNSFTGLEDEPVYLVDLAGQPTDVSLIRSLPFGQAFFDSPDTTGDIGAVLDDYLDLHSVPSEFMFMDLRPGEYLLYSYAWPPDNPNFKTSLWVNDDDANAQLITGPWPGGFQQGVTHALHTAIVRDDRTLILHTFGIGKGTLSGMQLVPQAFHLVIEPEGDVLKVVTANLPAQTSFRVTLNDETLIGSPVLHFRPDSTSDYSTVDMVSTGPDVWTGTLPGFTCADRPEFFISAAGSQSGEHPWPLEAAEVPLVVRVRAQDGDMNGDHAPDGHDISSFVSAVLSESSDLTDLCHGDFDESGVVDVGDADGFIASLLSE